MKRSLYKLMLREHKQHKFYDETKEAQWEGELLVEHFYLKSNVLDNEQDWAFNQSHYYQALCSKNNVHHWCMCGDDGYAVVHYIAAIDRYVSLIYKCQRDKPLIVNLVGVFVYMEYFDWGTLDD